MLSITILSTGNRFAHLRSRTWEQSLHSALQRRANSIPLSKAKTSGCSAASRASVAKPPRMQLTSTLEVRPVQAIVFAHARALPARSFSWLWTPLPARTIPPPCVIILPLSATALTSTRSEQIAAITHRISMAVAKTRDDWTASVGPQRSGGRPGGRDLLGYREE